RRPAQRVRPHRRRLAGARLPTWRVAVDSGRGEVLEAAAGARLLTPRSATELVDAAVQLMRRHFRSLALLAALIAIPSLFLGIIARIVQPPAPTGATPEAMAAALASSASMLGVLA